jgi:hypothetical protein
LKASKEYTVGDLTYGPPGRPSYEDTSLKVNVAGCEADMCNLAIALTSYNIVEEKYPSQLTPDLRKPIAHIHAIPADRFSPDGKIYKYESSKDGWKLWSIGPDGKDDKGKLEYDPSNGLRSTGDIIKTGP